MVMLFLLGLERLEVIILSYIELFVADWCPVRVRG